MKLRRTLLALVVLLCAVAMAQQGSPQQGPPQQAPPRRDGDGPPPPRDGEVGPPRRKDGPPLEALEAGQRGRWWLNVDTAQKLSLTPDQQKKMEDIFQQHRVTLVDLNAAVQKAELGMEPLLETVQPDQPKILAQLDRAAQARAELEKAHARMLLGLRAVLTVDQWKKLQTEAAANRGRGGPGRRGDGPGEPPLPPPGRGRR